MLRTYFKLIYFLLELDMLSQSFEVWYFLFENIYKVIIMLICWN